VKNVQTVKGDLLAEVDGFIIHGCNDVGVMGSGVARGVKARFPGAFALYEERHKAHGLPLGSCTFYRHNHKLWIVNAITQKLNVPNPLSYEALAACFARTLSFMEQVEEVENLPKGFFKLKMPKIGSARGGGDWDLISSIIDYEVGRANILLGAKREAIVYVVDQEPSDCR